MATNPITAVVEEWRDVLGYEGSYQVSSLGNVRRITEFAKVREGLYRPVSYRIMTLYPDRRSGYPQARLSVGAKARTVLAHRIVCEAFHGPAPFPKAQVAHGDGSRDNNRADNLRWATVKENAEDRVLHGTAPIGEGAGNARLTERDVSAIRAAYSGVRGEATVLAERFGITISQVLNIVKRRQWTHID